MENLHPEYAALSGIILNIIIEVCKAHGVAVDAATQGNLTILIMWIVTRIARRALPPGNVELVQQIKKNLTQKQDDHDDQQQATATAIAQAIPATMVIAAAKAAQQQDNQK